MKRIVFGLALITLAPAFTPILLGMDKRRLTATQPGQTLCAICGQSKLSAQRSGGSSSRSTTLSERLVILNCGHTFHHQCLQEVVEQKQVLACPTCNTFMQPGEATALGIVPHAVASLGKHYKPRHARTASYHHGDVTLSRLSLSDGDTQHAADEQFPPLSATALPTTANIGGTRVRFAGNFPPQSTADTMKLLKGVIQHPDYQFQENDPSVKAGLDVVRGGPRYSSHDKNAALLLLEEACIRSKIAARQVLPFQGVFTEAILNQHEPITTKVPAAGMLAALLYWDLRPQISSAVVRCVRRTLSEPSAVPVACLFLEDCLSGNGNHAKPDATLLNDLQPALATAIGDKECIGNLVPLLSLIAALVERYQVIPKDNLMRSIFRIIEKPELFGDAGASALAIIGSLLGKTYANDSPFQVSSWLVARVKNLALNPESSRRWRTEGLRLLLRLAHTWPDEDAYAPSAEVASAIESLFDEHQDNPEELSAALFLSCKLLMLARERRTSEREAYCRQLLLRALPVAEQLLSNGFETYSSNYLLPARCLTILFEHLLLNANATIAPGLYATIVNCICSKQLPPNLRNQAFACLIKYLERSPELVIDEQLLHAAQDIAINPQFLDTGRGNAFWLFLLMAQRNTLSSAFDVSEVRVAAQALVDACDTGALAYNQQVVEKARELLSALEPPGSKVSAAALEK